MHGKNTSININIKLANFFCIVCKISSVLSAFFFQSGQIYHNVVFLFFSYSFPAGSRNTKNIRKIMILELKEQSLID